MYETIQEEGLDDEPRSDDSIGLMKSDHLKYVNKNLMKLGAGMVG